MVLVVASEEERRERDRLTFEAWGSPLTVEGFSRRELRLRAHPWARESMISWLWKDSAGGILASCETFRMPSLLRGVSGTSFGVASVFTAPALRGRGHALAMMRALADRLATEPGAHAALLYSEVGATLYHRAGFQPRSCHDRLFDVGGEAPAGARFYGEAEVAELLARFTLPGDAFVVWPGAAQIDWHLERGRFYAEALGRPALPACGVEVGGARAIWAADHRNDRLAILVVEAEDEESATAVVHAARHVASRSGLQRVLVWETPGLPLPAALGERVARDDDALPMLLPLAPDVRPDDWRTIPRALWA